MIERKWLAVTATPLTVDGTLLGAIIIADTAGFFTKQLVFLASSTQKPTQFQVQEVVSKTRLILGPVNSAKIGRQFLTDVSAFRVLDNAVIAAGEQDRLALPPEKDHYSAIYASDPIVADRVIFVDQYGKYYGEGNPLPIAFDGTIAIGKVEVEGKNGNTVEPNVDGSINVNIVTAQTSNKVKNKYGAVSSVAAGIETTIVSYTVPVLLKNAILQRISVSGQNVGRFQVFINGSIVDTRRTYYGGNFSEYFEFAVNTTDGFTLNPSDVVLVKILHNTPYVGDFESRIQVYEIV